MGQYYRIVFLNSKRKNISNKVKICASMRPHDFGNGAKLTEFSWIGNHFVGVLEELINKEHGKYAGYPIVVAGDYADNEPRCGKNLYDLAAETAFPKITSENAPKPHHYRYIINVDRKVFFDCDRVKPSMITEYDGEKVVWKVHPLTILCSDGCNGGERRGGGDYSNKHRMVGAWRRQVVVTSDSRPNESEYREVFYNFYNK